MSLTNKKEKIQKSLVNHEKLIIIITHVHSIMKIKVMFDNLN